MTAAIHQPNFFPWPGYFRKMAESDVFIFLDNVDITLGSSKSITHRTRIKTAQGEAWLSVPLRKGSSKLIREQQIDNSQPWARKMLTTLHHNYARCPFYASLMEWFEPFLLEHHENLSELNIRLIRRCCAMLDITTTTRVASEMEPESTDRNNRLIQLCVQAGADEYLSGKGGAGYNAEEEFASRGVRIRYIQYPDFVYPQLHGPFLAGLSLLDMYCNLGPESKKFFTSPL